MKCLHFSFIFAACEAGGCGVIDMLGVGRADAGVDQADSVVVGGGATDVHVEHTASFEAGRCGSWR